jgi:hypothetical protein
MFLPLRHLANGSWCNGHVFKNYGMTHMHSSRQLGYIKGQIRWLLVELIFLMGLADDAQELLKRKEVELLDSWLDIPSCERSGILASWTKNWTEHTQAALEVLWKYTPWKGAGYTKKPKARILLSCCTLRTKLGLSGAWGRRYSWLTALTDRGMSHNLCMVYAASHNATGMPKGGSKLQC